MNLLGVGPIREQTDNWDINVDLQVSINEHGQNTYGDGLWLVGMWASAYADGTGPRIGYTKQVRYVTIFNIFVK